MVKKKTEIGMILVLGSIGIIYFMTRPLVARCTPGEIKCMFGDLVQCNSTGTSWILLEENSPYCNI